MRTRIPAVTSGEPLDPGMPADLTDGSARPPGWLPVAAAAVFLAVLGSCDSDPVVEPEPALEIVPDSVTLTHIGDQFAFTVRGGEAVRWNSLDLAVFTVDADGTVTARGNGTAQVRAWTPESSDHALVRVQQLADVLETFGEGQRAAAGLSLIEPVGVRVLDAGGAPVSGMAVRFEVDLGGGRVEFAEVLSDSTGLAGVEWTLGPEPGPQTLVVSAEGVASVQIAATALELDEAVASFEVPSGGDQWAWSGRALPEPVVVQARDEGGRPLRGATVRFQPDAGGRADPGTAVSDSAGVASTAWTLGTAPGSQTLTVSAGGNARVQVMATARDPNEAVASVEVLSGEEQWALAGRQLPDPVSVGLVDDAGQPIWGATVRFDPEAGSGRADPAATITDSLGLASAVWTLGPEVGAQRLVVSAADLKVVFGAKAVSDQGVCNRTPEVSAEITRRARAANCADVTEEMLGGITQVFVSRQGLSRLRSGDFAGLAGLDALELIDNQLSELPPGIFNGLSRLRRLNLSFNQISELPPGLFRGLSGLRELSLRRNRLTAVATGDFADLDRLERLVIDYNELQELPSDVFSGLTQLKILALNRNQLTSLPEDIFDGLSRLEEIWLGVNRLTELPPRLFADKPMLFRIQLRNNDLTELPPELFSETPALRRLFLNGNDLTLLPPDIFAGLDSLTRLDLSFNDLAELPSGIFQGTPKLAQLSLGWNELDELPHGVFAGLSELEWVTLRSNPGADFGVRPEFVRVDVANPLAAGPARLIARVPLGAPFAFDMPVSVQRGRASRDFVSFLPGDSVSAPITVSATGAGAAHAGFGPPPRVTAEGYTGLELIPGEELVLFAETDNRSPVARSRIPAHRLQDEGPSADVALSDYFSDPDGDPLTYSVATTRSGVVAAWIEEGVLWLDPLSVDTTEVEVTANDPGGLRATLRFQAWVVPAPDPDAFNIELYFEPGFTAEEERTIRRAADRWMEAVTGDLPDMPLDELQELFGQQRLPRSVGVIDDLLIRMSLKAIGGAAYAGVYGRREESGHVFLGGASYSLGYVRDRDQAELYNLALHEIGHVLGIGDWTHGGALPSWGKMFRDEHTDPHFAGPLAVAAFNAAGGEGYPGGKVPLEDRVPTLHIHWRQSVIPGDVMSPYGESLLTAITLQALADLGHVVDVSKADPYTLPGQVQGDAQGAAARVEAAIAESFADDVIEGPVVVVDKNGKVVRVIRP